MNGSVRFSRSNCAWIVTDADGLELGVCPGECTVTSAVDAIAAATGADRERVDVCGLCSTLALRDDGPTIDLEASMAPLDDSGVRERLCRDVEPILSSHRDSREPS